jgi:hypothetical protein
MVRSILAGYGVDGGMKEGITPDKDEEAATTRLALQGVGRLFGIRAVSKHYLYCTEYSTPEQTGLCRRG